LMIELSLNGHDEVVVLKVKLMIELSCAEDGAHGCVAGQDEVQMTCIVEPRIELNMT
ncbi:hypothetical protein A2U01_0027257, partial [Trifolium medium]|nr:hypothetical protein [Trifolium medium]